MHEVTCTHCGRVVQVSPDAPRCSICGHDLHARIPEHVAASYFYRRAAELAARGDVESALAEAERGIGFVESSELRLLSAILSKRLGDPDTMRAHVAAIPVDDRLRQEAEWLIRAQSAQRTGEPRVRADMAQQSTANAATRAQSAESAPDDTAPERASPFEGTTQSPAAVAAPRASRTVLWTQRAWGFVALVLVLIAGAMGWTLLSKGPDALLALLPGIADEAQPPPRAGAPLQAVTPVPLQLPTPTPQGGLQNAQEDTGQDALQEPPPSTPSVPGDLVVAPAPEPLADAAAAAAAAAGIHAAVFDLDAVLSAAGRNDLAALDLVSDVQGTTVRVSGVVTNTADRETILELTQAVPGVRDVNAVELLVRVPQTYRVQEGDSLWRIVERFYGADATRVAEIYELNRDSLPSAQALQVGMEIRLPPADP